MKTIFFVILVLSFFSPLFAGVTEKELVDRYARVEISKAIEDFDDGIYDKKGSEIYQKAWNELESGAVKTSTGDGVALGIMGTLLLSCASSSAYDAAVRECIDRCMRWDSVPYRVCKRDCNIDPNTH